MRVSHASAGNIVMRIRGSFVAWLSASLRLERNIASKCRLDSIARGRFALMFKSWKALRQRNEHQYTQLVPKPIIDRRFQQFVY